MPETPIPHAAGVYVHIPFCAQKCAYCDFVSYAGREDRLPGYVDALIDELDARSMAWRDTTLSSLYLGGGTPSLMPAPLVALWLHVMRTKLSWAPEVECTIEANPGMLDAAKIEGYLAAGVNRLSLGVQSLCNDELVMLGRIHNAETARRAVALARTCGVGNLSLDLMFGLPRQTPVSWRDTLQGAIELEPEHLSLYALTVEEDTPLAARIAHGALPVPDDDLAADMYELARELLAGAGYIQYEISNWARRSPGDEDRLTPHLASRHNLTYWRNRRYLGLGAAAHSFDGRHRTANTPDLEGYIADAGTGKIVVMDECLSADQRMDETMMLGLRLLGGVSRAAFRDRFGQGLDDVYAAMIRELVEQGLLVDDGARIRLSDRGLLLGNRVFGAFLREEV